MAPIKKPVRSKIGELFEPVQLNLKNRLPPKGLDTCKPPLRRSARLREKNINREVDYSSISRRQSFKKAKIRENRRQGQLQQKSKSPQTKRGKKGRSTKRKSRNQPQPLRTSRRVRSDCKRPRTRDTQKIKSGVNRNKGNPIENWLSTVPLSLETLVDPFLPKKSENMPRNAALSLHESHILAGTNATPSVSGVRTTNFRGSLGKRNIFINNTDPSMELEKRAKAIIANKILFPEMNDARAKELAAIAWNLETGNEQELVTKFATLLIPHGVSHQNLESSIQKVWSNAVEVPLRPNQAAIPSPLRKPNPDLVFGYSEAAFDPNQSIIMDLLVDDLGQDYAMPDGNVRFPFFIIEFKSQATGGTHFVATNQVANAGAVAMEGTLQLARRISAEEKIDFDEPTLFSLSVDHTVACINIHWLSRKAENGAFSFHMRHLQKHFLDVDGLKAVDRAVKNILDYGANKRLEKIRGELDIYSQKVKEKAIIDKGNLASESLPEEQQQQRPPRKRKNADLLANRRIKRPRPAQEKIADDEDEDEDEEDIAAQHQQAHPKPVRASARLSAVRVPKKKPKL